MLAAGHLEEGLQDHFKVHVSKQVPVFGMGIQQSARR